MSMQLERNNLFDRKCRIIWLMFVVDAEQTYEQISVTTIYTQSHRGTKQILKCPW